MIDAEQNPRNRALMRLLYISGIRSSEAINLRTCDLLKHETGGQITVTAKGGKTLAVWIDQTTWEMINNANERIICQPISGDSDSLRSASREISEGICGETVKDGRETVESRNAEMEKERMAFVFQTSSGRPLHLNHVGKIVRAAAKRIGINKNVSPHWLRHATATHLMDAGVSLVAIKEHLGHETIQTTTRYTHVKPSAANAKLLAW
jgi:integrase/recombinase XerD